MTDNNIQSENKNAFINKLPQITATTLGETGGDWLSMTMDVGYLKSTLIFFALFIVAVGAQLAGF